ncbi:hypothetical protein CANCADRAFT_45206 [Tortispora caseinolytica NRRL Y-17796]|uniref:Uncharacterized protein n=1 Tax=Tortispora caseinolytica NRRL Y-17796 TaxID=767744 RepID=A0A1E4TAC3_9ASCO|nr:hypothetical protein CANCADRAFT_45206 [Tortispora caseinolytica NRRL Y-17796]
MKRFLYKQCIRNNSALANPLASDSYRIPSIPLVDVHPISNDLSQPVQSHTDSTTNIDSSDTHSYLSFKAFKSLPRPIDASHSSIIALNTAYFQSLLLLTLRSELSAFIFKSSSSFALLDPAVADTLPEDSLQCILKYLWSGPAARLMPALSLDTPVKVANVNSYPQPDDELAPADLPSIYSSHIPPDQFAIYGAAKALINDQDYAQARILLKNTFLTFKTPSPGLLYLALRLVDDKKEAMQLMNVVTAAPSRMFSSVEHSHKIVLECILRVVFLRPDNWVERIESTVDQYGSLLQLHALTTLVWVATITKNRPLGYKLWQLFKQYPRRYPYESLDAQAYHSILLFAFALKDYTLATKVVKGAHNYNNLYMNDILFAPDAPYTNANWIRFCRHPNRILLKQDVYQSKRELLVMQIMKEKNASLTDKIKKIHKALFICTKTATS